MGGIPAAVGPVGPELQANARQSEEACKQCKFYERRVLYRQGLLQREENERFLSILLGAGSPQRYVPTVVVPVIVLGSKDEGG
jgi:hypothetical protein